MFCYNSYILICRYLEPRSWSIFRFLSISQHFFRTIFIHQHRIGILGASVYHIEFRLRTLPDTAAHGVTIFSKIQFSQLFFALSLDRSRPQVTWRLILRFLAVTRARFQKSFTAKIGSQSAASSTFSSQFYVIQRFHEIYFRVFILVSSCQVCYTFSYKQLRRKSLCLQKLGRRKHSVVLRTVNDCQLPTSSVLPSFLMEASIFLHGYPQFFNMTSNTTTINIRLKLDIIT